MHTASRPARLLAAAAAALLAAGCASVNPPPPVDVLPTQLPMVQAPAQPAVHGRPTGSLFHAASYRPGFEDPRARYVGDLVSIRIEERIEAQQNSKSTIGRNSKTSAGITDVPLLPSKVAAKVVGHSKLGAGSETTFNGNGDTSSKNKFESSITAVVTEVLPNGHLVITGEKQVGVNRSVDVLRFSGIVDPRNLRRSKDGFTPSEIRSEYVANVRVVSRWLGEQAEAQAMGWLARAFNNVTPF